MSTAAASVATRRGARLFAVTLCFALLGAGCGPRVGIDDATTGTGEDTSASDASTRTSSGTASTSSTSTSTTSSDATSATTGSSSAGGEDVGTLEPDVGVVTLCPNPNPNYQCDGGPGCNGDEYFGCGAPFNRYDSMSCLRFNCDEQTACADGEVCFRPMDYGHCAPTEYTCSDDNLFNICDCETSDDCDGRYCLAQDKVPPDNCSDYDDGASCSEAGCSDFRDGWMLTLEDDTCVCTPIEECMWTLVGTEPVEDQVGQYVPGQPGVYVFEVYYSPPPLGWTACTGAAGEPPECACLDEFDLCP
jgi:hypothetical protein